jgi:nucleoredoxin
VITTRRRPLSRWTVLALGGLCGWAAVACSESPAGPGPPVSLAELFGNTLLLADGTAVGIEALEEKRFIGIYFGARGCPACAVFTPRLVAAHEELREAGRSFEVVYVSSDVSSASMFQYMVDAGMEWLALPWGGRRSRDLGQRYDVRWIPTLIVVDGSGRTVSANGRDEIAEHGAGAYDVWLAGSGGR